MRVLRIDAERRRLGLSLRQVEELDKEPEAAEALAEGHALEESSARGETTPSLETLPSAPARPRDQRPDRRERGERAVENSILTNLPEESETTAMAEAFRAAARQLNKDEDNKAE